MTTKFKRKGPTVLLGMFQHCLHTGRVVRRLERLSRVRNRNRDLDFRSFVRIGCPNKTFLAGGLIDGSHGVTNVRRATAATMHLTPGMSPSVRRVGHQMSDVGRRVVLGGQRRSFGPRAGAGGSTGAQTARTSGGPRPRASEGNFLGYRGIRKRNSIIQENGPY